MGKNPLDLNRKLIKYQQQVKVLKRGLQVKYQHLTSPRPDFALGNFQVKGSSAYSLILNVDLPRKSNGLQIDFWGLQTVNNNGTTHLERLNRTEVNLVNREVRAKFWTYPKTRYLFITFQILQDEQDDDSKKNPLNYTINYVYLESKDPLPRNIITPAVPSSFQLNYDLECHPRMLAELDLDDPLSGFNLPINLEVFEHSLLNYLLQKETSPGYLESLKQNIKSCQVNPSRDKRLPYYRQVELDELKKIKQQVLNKSQKLEELLSKIDNLIHHKHSLENMLDRPDGDVEYLQQEKQQNYLDVLNKFHEGLNLKLNHILSLKELNHQSKNLRSEDLSSIEEILNYYENRVLKDRRKIKQELELAEIEFTRYKQKHSKPSDQQQHNDQRRLDNMLVSYRQCQQKSKELKQELDKLIIKFIIVWYQYILTLNYPRIEY